jgi:hypothetical protein
MRKILAAAISVSMMAIPAGEAVAKQRSKRTVTYRDNYIVRQPERPWLYPLVALETDATRFDHTYPNYGGAFYCQLDPHLAWSGYGYQRVWFPYCH